MPSLTDPVGRVRFVGLVEAVSFLVLLGVAMPLKYFAGMPTAVLVVGWAHGVLFMAYIPAVFIARKAMNWGFAWTVLALKASLFPFGTFIMDKYLVRREKELMNVITE